MHQVILNTNGRKEVYGTYQTREEAERIADGLRQADWATLTTVEVR